MRIDMRPAALACANEACRNMSGPLDLDAMVRHFEKLGGLPTNPFVVGPATMERVFHAADLTDMSDMQAVLNAVEAALASAPAGDHPDDIAVNSFAAAMKAKLAKARDAGRGGWDDPAQCTVEHLRELMLGHVAKGDPVDVANFCMMLFHRGGSTSAPAGDGVERDLTPTLIASARGHLANVRAHGNAEANACAVFEAVLDAATAIAALARPRAAVEPWNDPQQLKEDFLAAILARSPNGEPVTVAYHPNGDWSVFDSPRAAVGEQSREEVEKAAKSLEALADWLLANDHDMNLPDAVTDDPADTAAMLRRLALQYPPAKVEGKR